MPSPETPPPIDTDCRIGLCPAPWSDTDWPTYGYDGYLAEFDWNRTFSIQDTTGHTRAQWVDLAETMIARWTAYRAHLLTLPADTP